MLEEELGKVGINFFLLYICMYWQLCRNYELHYANSSTSFHEFIYFIELTHTAAVAEGDD